MTQPAHMDEAPPIEANPEDTPALADQGHRQLPCNIEMEQELLGAILVNNAAMDKVLFLKPEHFFEPVHGDIFAACATLIEKGQTADPVRLKPLFASHEGLEDVGGTAYLVRLCSSTAAVISAMDYGREIYNMARRRLLIGLSQELGAAAQDFACDVDELIGQMETELDELIPETSDSGAVAFTDVVDIGLEAMRAAHEEGGKVGVSSGLTDLDDKIGGFVPGDLIYLAGRPSMGKTALALSFAKTAAKAGEPVHYFNLESSTRRLSMRSLAMLAADMGFNVAYADAWQGKMDMTDRGTMQQAGELNRSLPLFIHDVSELSASQLKGRLRRAKLAGNIGLVIVDYLQIMTPSYRKGYQSNRTGDMTELSRALKSIAKQFDAPLIALSQLSRLVESRENKRPLLSDLRESGALEQDADVVLMVYRHIYYLEKQEPKKFTTAHTEWDLEMTECRNQVEVLIPKQRDGPSGIGITIYGNMPSNDFRDLHRDQLV